MSTEPFVQADTPRSTPTEEERAAELAEANPDGVETVGIETPVPEQEPVTEEATETTEEEAVETEEPVADKPLDEMTKAELQERASSLGLEFGKTATKAKLIKLIDGAA